uniref:hypothetical protein n=1 Tax=Phyllosticta yuccae TaxID=1151444 RepID=UPI0027A22F1D|nr:hypothetical protein QLP54_mgp30 [Phyllosticta yuccae]WGC90051.1 hypothetical protein [Phyllosticta yuccae]
MVRAILPEIYCSSSPCIGNCLGCDGALAKFSFLNGGRLKWDFCTSYVGYIIKNKSGWPKESVWTNDVTVGLPKGSNSYGGRVIIVPTTVSNITHMGRVTVNNVSFARGYSTGRTTDSESNITKKLENLFERSTKFPQEPIDRPLHKLVSDIDILSLAYNKLKSNPGQMTPGVKPETLDGVSLESLQDISNKLNNESFQFSPGYRFLKHLVVPDLLLLLGIK